MPIHNYSLSEYGVKRAFVWNRNSGMQSLDALSDVGDSGARLVNNNGQIIGDGVDANFQVRGCTWQQGVPQDLMVDDYSISDINDNGLMVGRRVSAYAWQFGLPAVSLGALEADSSKAAGVNNQGQVVGTSGLDGTGWHAVLWQAGLAHQDLGALAGYSNSEAYEIGDNGQVVGAAYGQNTSRAFIWQESTLMQPLLLPTGYAESLAFDINNSGQAVGWISRTTENAGKAVLWMDGGYVDLNEIAGAESSRAVSINNKGQVAGWARIDGMTHAVIWEPVPEPSSLLVLLGGVGAVGLFRRRSRSRPGA